MKKYLLSLLLVGGALFTSCDMNQLAPGELQDTESLQTVNDAMLYRNNIYASFRALCSGAYVTDVELEMDHFVGVIGNGSRGQNFSTAAITSANGDIADNYYGCYSVMKNINFLISEGEGILANGNLNDADKEDMQRYLGEAHYFRAFIYYWLYDHYCQAYDPARADQAGLGLQIVTKYNPTGIPAEWPGRSSMKASFDLINGDLETAFNYLKEYETTVSDAQCTPDASYLSSYAVAATQARIALLQKNYTEAIAKANYVIDSKIFALATGNSYLNMWSKDTSDELIFVPFVDAAESAYVGSFLDAWAYTSSYPTRVDYVPTLATYEMYGDTDIRQEAFFKWQRRMNIEGETVNAYIFFKYPGNSSLVSGADEYKNKPKPLRLSEQYLILAEAAAESGNASLANSALTTLRMARISDYDQSTYYSGSALIDEVRLERDRELIGEGFRMSDLRRWNLGFTRDGSSWEPTSSIADFYILSNVNVAFVPGDYRYVWPIPSDEMQTTPALAGQQNPGYN